MKKFLLILLSLILMSTYCLFAIASSSDEDTTENQGTDKVEENPASDNAENQGEDTAEKGNDNSNLGDYTVEIKSCRLAKAYDGKDVIIVTYGFTNNSDDPASFNFTFTDNAYQAGIGLNEAYFLDDSANYSSDNQMKDIKTGATLDVEIAYELNDSTTDIEVEVKELISFNDKVITKTFKIS